jgi:lipoprotein-anchoring transpeptidase ErfK/SrfK
MRGMRLDVKCLLLGIAVFLLSSCSYYTQNNMVPPYNSPNPPPKPLMLADNQVSKSRVSHSSRMPSHINTSEKVIVIDPRVHAWGAYDANGNLLRSGIATAGSGWCPDIRRSCRTRVGTFRIYSLGSFGCKSSRYPLPRGGAPMPYCMFFNGNQGLHGSYNVVDGNASHGCVRLHVDDAEWVRFNFANHGTKVIVRPY